MTAADAIALLAKLPASTPICFTVGDSLLETTEIELVAATRDGDGFTVSFDGAPMMRCELRL